LADSIPVPLSLLTETREALEAALRVAKPERDESELVEVYGKIFRAKEGLEKAMSGGPNGANMRQRGYLLLRRLDEMKRELKREYGLEG
jgi:hypothetical protein